MAQCGQLADARIPARRPSFVRQLHDAQEDRRPARGSTAQARGASSGSGKDDDERPARSVHAQRRLPPHDAPRGGWSARYAQRPGRQRTVLARSFGAAGVAAARRHASHPLAARRDGRDAGQACRRPLGHPLHPGAQYADRPAQAVDAAPGRGRQPLCLESAGSRRLACRRWLEDRCQGRHARLARATGSLECKLRRNQAACRRGRAGRRPARLGAGREPQGAARQGLLRERAHAPSPPCSQRSTRATTSAAGSTTCSSPTRTPARTES